MEQPTLRFNGQRRDPNSGAYHLGNGYRAYQPSLRRFSCPDSFSPFGAGGINSYCYCAGDPVNRVDPSGHFSWQAGLGIGLSVLGILGALWSGGASLAVTGSLSAALDSAGAMPLLTGAANLLADISGLGSTLVHNPHLSLALGWLSFAAGVLSLGAGIPPILSEAMAALRQRLGTIRRIGLSGGAEVAGREMASERQILSHEQRMVIINDPQEMKHEIHKLNPHLITSNNTQGRFTSRLRAEYHPDKWVIWSMERSPDSRIFISDLVEYQYRRIARKQGFFGVMPDRIEQRLVVNLPTKILTVDKQGDELREVFLTQTPGGKLMQRLGNIFGYTFTHIETRGNVVDYISHIDNGL
mgnify:CR=1 FL=1